MTTQVGYNRETLLEMFRSREVTVKFHKQDGDVRVLRGTLREDIIPDTKHTKKGHSDLITVWDLDVADWRSFHPESVFEVI
jgi:hypothetical protein